MGSIARTFTDKISDGIRQFSISKYIMFKKIQYCMGISAGTTRKWPSACLALLRGENSKRFSFTPKSPKT